MCVNCAPCHRDTQGMRSAERNTSLPIRRPVDIVVRRLAAPGREPVNWSDNLLMHLQKGCLSRDPDQSRGTRQGLHAIRATARRGEVVNRTSEAAGGSRAY